jgi:hypothetical protein
MPVSRFASVALQVSKDLRDRRLYPVKIATVDRDAEWQRVNSYIADVLKDTHVLYAKLARLQGDFIGRELDELEKISESVLSLGEELSQFSKAFYEGKLSMAEGDMAYGTPPGPPAEGGGHAAPPGGAAAPEAYEVPVEVEEEAPPPAEAEQE